MTVSVEKLKALLPKLHTAAVLLNDISDAVEGMDIDAFEDPTVRAMLAEIQELDHIGEQVTNCFAAVAGSLVILGVEPKAVGGAS